MTAPQSSSTSTSTQEQPARKIDLNLTQVTAGALAAVTTALFTSQLGAAGTLIGAGGASIVTTVGTSVYQASLERSRRRVRELALRTRPVPYTRGSVPTQRYPSNGWGVPAQGAPTQGTQAQGGPTHGMPTQGMPPQGMPTQGVPTQRYPGTGPTQAMPSGGRTQRMPAQGSTQVGGRPDGPYRPPPPYGPPPQGPDAAGQGGATQAFPAQPPPPGEPADASAEPASPSRAARVFRWSAVLAGAVAAFALAMIAITGFEAASGETLGGNGSGTTIGRIANSQPGPEQPVVPAAPESSAPSSVAPTESSAPSQSSESPESGTESSDLKELPGLQRSQEPQTSAPQPQPSDEQAPQTRPGLPLPGIGR